MRKIASHYLITNQLYRFHYLQVENGQYYDVSPLRQEEPGVEFLNGLLWVVTVATPSRQLPWIELARQYPGHTLRQLLEEELTGEILPGEQVLIYHFPDLSLTASELSTDNSCSNRYIQRF